MMRIMKMSQEVQAFSALNSKKEEGLEYHGIYFIMIRLRVVGVYSV